MSAWAHEGRSRLHSQRRWIDASHASCTTVKKRPSTSISSEGRWRSGARATR